MFNILPQDTFLFVIGGVVLIPGLSVAQAASAS